MTKSLKFLKSPLVVAPSMFIVFFVGNLIFSGGFVSSLIFGSVMTVMYFIGDFFLSRGMWFGGAPPYSDYENQEDVFNKAIIEAKKRKEKKH